MSVMWLLLMACGEPAADRTLITDVQLVNLQTEPPAAAPGDTIQLAATVADPKGRELEVLFFACTPVNDRCVESGLGGGRPLAEWTGLAPVTDGEANLALVVPLELEEVEEADSAVTSLIWALACEVGQCPIMDRVRADPPPDTPDWQTLVLDLADVETLIGELPFDTASLGAREFRVTYATGDGRNANPTVRPQGPVGEVRAGATVRLAFDAEASQQDAVVYPYTTAGAWSSSGVTAVGGLAPLSWVAPDEPGPATLYVVAEDGIGGSGVWSVDVDVR